MSNPAAADFRLAIIDTTALSVQTAAALADLAAHSAAGDAPIRICAGDRCDSIERCLPAGHLLDLTGGEPTVEDVRAASEVILTGPPPRSQTLAPLLQALADSQASAPSRLNLHNAGLPMGGTVRAVLARDGIVGALRRSGRASLRDHRSHETVASINPMLRLSHARYAERLVYRHACPVIASGIDVGIAVSTRMARRADAMSEDFRQGLLRHLKDQGGRPRVIYGTLTYPRRVKEYEAAVTFLEALDLKDWAGTLQEPPRQQGLAAFQDFVQQIAGCDRIIGDLEHAPLFAAHTPVRVVGLSYGDDAMLRCLSTLANALAPGSACLHEPLEEA